jgi:hypothetical protein
MGLKPLGSAIQTLATDNDDRAAAVSFGQAGFCFD